MSEETKTTGPHSASAAGVDPCDTYGLKDFAPATYAVNGEKILSLLIQTIEKYLVLPKHGAITIALWVFFTHAYQCFDINPRLALLSPEKRCGKTTLFDLLTHVTPRALLSSHVTPAVVYRIIELAGPTLLNDEFDSFKNLAEELRGILNSGHRRAGAFVYRCVGDTHQPKAFSTWAPTAYAGIGNLSDTLEDRSIIVLMRRRAQTEKVERLRWSGKQGEALGAFLGTLAVSIARWVSDHREALCEHEPTIPEGLNDRAGDNWFPLLAIAEMISEKWLTVRGLRRLRALVPTDWRMSLYEFSCFMMSGRSLTTMRLS